MASPRSPEAAALTGGTPPARRSGRLAPLALGALAACTGPTQLVFAPPGAVPESVETVLVSTVRAPDPGPAIFSEEPARDLGFGRFEIAVPPGHRLGVAPPRPTRPPDPESQFLLASACRLPDERAFVDAVNARLAAVPSRRKAGLFIHGFRNNFADTLLYQAQLQSDLDQHGAVVQFAWPTTPRTFSYLRDLDRALTARDALERTIDLIAESDAEGITLVSTSLGSFLLMDTLRTMARGGHERALAKISAIVLVSADIEPELFRTQVNSVAGLGKPIYVVTSRRDRALRLAAMLRGERFRLGSAPPETLADLPVTVVDVTKLPVGDRYRHFVLSESPDLIRFVRMLHHAGSQVMPQPGNGSGTHLVHPTPPDRCRPVWPGSAPS